MSKSEEGICSECGGILFFYPKPLDKNKMEAFCQKCKGMREKDSGRPSSLKPDIISKEKENREKKER